MKNAFLHGALQEELYMEQPPGSIAQDRSGLVCKLKITNMGLQSLRAWSGKISEVVLNLVSLVTVILSSSGILGWGVHFFLCMRMIL